MKEGASQKITNINSTNTTSAINTVSYNNMNIANNNTAANNDDNTLEVVEQLQTMSTADDNVSLCANCGKEGANNICNKCKQVKYCNAVCKKVHKKKHKKDCEEHIRQIAEKHDEELFKQPPPLEDCPICFIQLPTRDSGKRYMSCCGKEICSGCNHAPVYDNQGNKIDEKVCAFCRTPAPTSGEDNIKRLKLRVEAGDPAAMYAVGIYYREGIRGFPQDDTMALELWHRSAELGYAKSFYIIGASYETGRGVEVDKGKALYYYKLGSMGGDPTARHLLALNEARVGNVERALKHHMIAVRSGQNNSLEVIKDFYKFELATKEDYTKALQSYQEYLGEIKSVQRDKAAADEDCPYY